LKSRYFVSLFLLSADGFNCEILRMTVTIFKVLVLINTCILMLDFQTFLSFPTVNFGSSLTANSDCHNFRTTKIIDPRLMYINLPFPIIYSQYVIGLTSWCSNLFTSIYHIFILIFLNQSLHKMSLSELILEQIHLLIVLISFSYM